jgi:hypothetical protein
MRVLITGVMLSLGLSPLLAHAQQPASEAQVAAMVEALRLAAPQTKNPNDGLYSDWKVKPDTLRGWGRFCLKQQITPTQFQNDPKLARQIVTCIATRELNNQLKANNNNEIAAVRGVGCWWMTGSYTGCDKGFTANYVQKLVRFYQESP